MGGCGRSEEGVLPASGTIDEGLESSLSVATLHTSHQLLGALAAARYPGKGTHRFQNVDAGLAMLVSVEGCSSPSTLLARLHHSHLYLLRLLPLALLSVR